MTRGSQGGVSHISKASSDRIEVRGRDLTDDLMGRLSFTEYFHLLLTGSEPTEDQRFFLDPCSWPSPSTGSCPPTSRRG